MNREKGEEIIKGKLKVDTMLFQMGRAQPVLCTVDENGLPLECSRTLGMEKILQTLGKTVSHT